MHRERKSRFNLELTKLYLEVEKNLIKTEKLDLK